MGEPKIASEDHLLSRFLEDGLQRFLHGTNKGQAEANARSDHARNIMGTASWLVLIIVVFCSTAFVELKRTARKAPGPGECSPSVQKSICAVMKVTSLTSDTNRF